MAGMVDGWRNVAGVTPEENAISGAIAETEREIFDSAFDDAPPENDYDDSLEWQEEIDGESHPDEYYAQELAGVDHNEPEPQPRYQQRFEPEPEIDLFADPEARLQQHIRQIAQHQYGQPIPGMIGTPRYDGPDIFAEPERALAHAAAMGADMARSAQYHEQRFNSSMASVHEAHGKDFEAAFDWLTNLDPNPGNQQLFASVWGAPDPGRALLEIYGSAHGADRVSRMLGGPGYLPRKSVNHAERAHGLSYEPPTSREGWEEQEIFNSAFEDW